MVNRYEKWEAKYISAVIYLFKVSNRNTRKRCETCFKLTIGSVFIGNFRLNNWLISRLLCHEFLSLEIKHGVARNSHSYFLYKKYVKFVLPVVSVKWSFMEMKNNGKSSLHEKCPNTELFLDTFHAEH